MAVDLQYLGIGSILSTIKNMPKDMQAEMLKSVLI